MHQLVEIGLIMLVFTIRPNEIVMQCDARAASTNNMSYKKHNLRSLESSPVLRFVQSFEEFHLMPQKPHFRPLDECEVVFREGLVLKHMMTSVNVVKETSKLQVNASGSIMNNLLKCLPELESHGFDVNAVF
ncbi:hypothetical protein Ddye_011405 [Dipteronia dyeriana]|uniref:Uncharacterized protein n=1 Tax=Dipteronia dyeriana TaxID=168575 RepID=A0AAE0CGV9_9ROSI|nr:hypothetical protein Ddye_011405 [Dipteronia dyeriana]